jgi:hypothetical protein
MRSLSDNDHDIFAIVEVKLSHRDPLELKPLELKPLELKRAGDMNSIRRQEGTEIAAVTYAYREKFIDMAKSYPSVRLISTFVF